MTPLSKLESDEMQKNNFALKFSVHKYNSYISGRTITIEEAAKCVVLQSQWAASHELVTLPDMRKLGVNVKLVSEIAIDSLGILVGIEIDEVGQQTYIHQFIVTDSESYWYFFDYTVASVTKDIEVGQGKTASVAKYT